MAILHLHRRGLYLLERARIRLDEGRVVYEAADTDDAGLMRSWNIPTLNSSAVLIGQGSSLSQPAARRLQADGVAVAFVGGGGTPLLMASQEYRPGERLQSSIAHWPNAAWRLAASKTIQAARREAVQSCWTQYRKEGKPGFRADPYDACESFEAGAARARSIEDLMGAEGQFVRALYSRAAKATGIQWDSRTPGEGSDRANLLLDHGNYLAYGLAAAVLWAYGIPAALPVTHGASRAGGLVFDLADAVQDAVILPTAFQCAAEPGLSDAAARQRMVDRLHGAACLGSNGTIGFLFGVMDRLLASAPARSVA